MRFSVTTTALLVEKALALWRGDRKQEALIAAADALDAAEAFSHDESRQAERSHQFVRGVVGLFFSEPVSSASNSPPPFSFGQASVLESTSAKLTDAQLKPLADNWRVLAAVEADLDIDAGIEARSMAKQTGALHFETERHVWTLRYLSSVRSEDPERALRSGLNIISAARAVKDSKPDATGLLRVDAKFAAGDPRTLIADPAVVEVVYLILLDILLTKTISGTVERTFLAAVDRASKAVFGDVPQIEAVLRAAANPGALMQGVGRAETLATGIAISDLQAKRSPVVRFYRDMMIVAHLPVRRLCPKSGQ
jgi:hypothetical protein